MKRIISVKTLYFFLKLARTTGECDSDDSLDLKSNNSFMNQEDEERKRMATPNPYTIFEQSQFLNSLNAIQYQEDYIHQNTYTPLIDSIHQNLGSNFGSSGQNEILDLQNGRINNVLVTESLPNTNSNLMTEEQQYISQVISSDHPCNSSTAYDIVPHSSNNGAYYFKYENMKEAPLDYGFDSGNLKSESSQYPDGKVNSAFVQDDFTLEISPEVQKSKILSSLVSKENVVNSSNTIEVIDLTSSDEIEIDSSQPASYSNPIISNDSKITFTPQILKNNEGNINSQNKRILSDEDRSSNSKKKINFGNLLMKTLQEVEIEMINRSFLTLKFLDLIDLDSFNSKSFCKLVLELFNKIICYKADLKALVMNIQSKNPELSLFNSSQNEICTSNRIICVIDQICDLFKVKTDSIKNQSGNSSTDDSEIFLETTKSSSNKKLNSVIILDFDPGIPLNFIYEFSILVPKLLGVDISVSESKILIWLFRILIKIQNYFNRNLRVNFVNYLPDPPKAANFYECSSDLRNQENFLTYWTINWLIYFAHQEDISLCFDENLLAQSLIFIFFTLNNSDTLLPLFACKDFFGQFIQTLLSDENSSMKEMKILFNEFVFNINSLEAKRFSDRSPSSPSNQLSTHFEPQLENLISLYINHFVISVYNLTLRSMNNVNLNQ